MHRLIVFLALALSAAAQQSAGGNQLHLRLSTANGQTQFRIGQSIPIVLTFESDKSTNDSVLTDVTPRRIRPQMPDQFSAEPAAGWVDPLQDLQWTAEGGVSSFLPGRTTLNATHPVSIARNLSEFIVFRAPGKYIVRGTSHRVIGAEGASLEPGSLALDILPRDEAEDARQFAAARAVLEAGQPPKEPERVMYMDKEKAQADAVNTLRALDTETAATYLASIFGQGRYTDREIEYALYASQHRAAIVAELERSMSDHDLTLTQTYLIALTQLKARIQEKATGHALSTAGWNALDEAVNQRVFETAATKAPQAKADTYFYLFETGSSSYRHTPAIRRLLLESLPAASPFTIEILLANNWSEIRDPALEPFLKQAVTRPWPQMSPSIGGLALLHLAEFDPTSATDLARDALLSGNLSVGDAQLLEFSVPPSPQLDQALLSQYRQGMAVEARIARFASPAAKDEFWNAYNNRRAPNPGPQCASPILAYFFRVDPVDAARRVAEARKGGEQNCMALHFYEVERALMSPGLEQQLVQDTRSTEPTIRSEALRALSVAGAPESLAALLQTLDETPGSQQEIIAAILQGRNWVLKADNYSRLEKHCAGTPYCQEIARARRESAPPYTLRMLDFAGHRGVWLSNREVDSLADLDAKLNLYPAGATFRWDAEGAGITAGEREMRDRVEQLLARHGMRLI